MLRFSTGQPRPAEPRRRRSSAVSQSGRGELGGLGPIPLSPPPAGAADGAVRVRTEEGEEGRRVQPWSPHLATPPAPPPLPV